MAIFTEITRNWRQELTESHENTSSTSEHSINGSKPIEKGEKPTRRNFIPSIYPTRVKAYLARAYELEESQGHQFHKIMPLLREASLPLLDACSDALTGLGAVFNAQNASRWYRKPANATDPLEEEQSERIAKLKRILELYISETRLKILKPYESIMQTPLHLDDSGENKADDTLPFSLRPLYFAYTFQSNLIVFARNEIALLDAVEAVQLKRKYNRYVRTVSIF